MRPEDLYEAMQQIRPEFLEDLMEQKRDKRAHRAFLIAAAVAVLGCVTAVAVTFSLRDTARADIGVKGTPVPEWTEYEIEGETAPETQPQIQVQPQPPEPEPVEHPWAPPGGWQDTVTLDSSFCSGDRVVAFLRVGGISPEIAEALAMLYQEPHEYAGYQWDVGGVQFPSGGDFSSLGIFHVSYDEASETALVRAEFNNVTGAKELAFGLSLLKNGDQYIYYEDVIIPVTPSEGLHTAVDMALPEEKHGGGMHAVAASVYAGYVEVEFTFTPFCEVAEPDELGEGEDIHYPDDRVENHARDAQHEYLLSLEDRACVALDDAALIDREGNSTLVVDLPANVHPYAYNGWESSRNSFPYDFIDGGKYAARFVTTQVIDLSQIAAITIGGVEYPLQ